MAWADVPAKLAKYRTIQYGGDVEADKLLNAFGVFGGDEDLVMVPSYRRAEFEEKLDYRLGACEQLVTSKAWSPEMLRKV